MPKPGTYIVMLKSGQAKTIQIGKLGQFNIQKGYYVYIGSAMGPGGVLARLKHHRNVGKKMHWHLDYLRSETEFYEVYALYSAERKECEWAALMAGSEAVSEPMNGFGSSDCRCNTHLFYFSSYGVTVQAIRSVQTARKIDMATLS